MKLIQQPVLLGVKNVGRRRMPGGVFRDLLVVEGRRGLAMNAGAKAR